MDLGWCSPLRGYPWLSFFQFVTFCSLFSISSSKFFRWYFSFRLVIAMVSFHAMTSGSFVPSTRSVIVSFSNCNLAMTCFSSPLASCNVSSLNWTWATAHATLPLQYQYFPVVVHYPHVLSGRSQPWIPNIFVTWVRGTFCWSLKIWVVLWI